MTNYWLLKTEPSAYSYADLERDGCTTWDGVNNPLALKHLGAMKKGDRVFIYHTGNEKQIVGIAEVVADSDAAPSLKVTGRLKTPVTLAEIKSRREFADFALVRISRLSVMPVEPATWKKLVAMAG